MREKERGGTQCKPRPDIDTRECKKEAKKKKKKKTGSFWKSRLEII